jgi:hypothetical protein
MTLHVKYDINILLHKHKCYIEFLPLRKIVFINTRKKYDIFTCENIIFASQSKSA